MKTALLVTFALVATSVAAAPPREISVVDYPSIQAAIQANPGRMLYVPAGDYEISRKIQIVSDHSGLFGPGRIIQTNPQAPIIEIERAAGVRLRDLTLVRPEGRQKTNAEGIIAIGCHAIWLDDLRVIDNQTRSAAIVFRECLASRIRGCLVQNYMQITIDDRTADHNWGYAFKCIDGTGIGISSSEGTLIEGCYIVEERLLPVPEIQQKFNLGKFVKKNAKKGTFISQKTWDDEYVSNWHQGSGLLVTSPEASNQTRILGNMIENAAQGIDIHSDHVIISQNLVHNAFIGMKAMHGSRNILVLGNQFSKNDLWSIGMMPGAASHGASPAREDKKEASSNEDGGSIIANNIISDFGYGHAHWIWGDERSPIKFDTGQKPDNPPLSDVLVQGNIIYGGSRAQRGHKGKKTPAQPRYRYAVIVSADSRGIRFANNIFHPGARGISNIELNPTKPEPEEEGQ